MVDNQYHIEQRIGNYSSAYIRALHFTFFFFFRWDGRYPLWLFIVVIAFFCYFQVKNWADNGGTAQRAKASWCPTECVDKGVIWLLNVFNFSFKKNLI